MQLLCCQPVLALVNISLLTDTWDNDPARCNNYSPRPDRNLSRLRQL